MIWFVEERSPFGTWCPVLYHGEKPVRKQMGQPVKVFRREPVAVKADTIAGAFMEVYQGEII